MEAAIFFCFLGPFFRLPKLPELGMLGLQLTTGYLRLRRQHVARKHFCFRGLGQFKRLGEAGGGGATIVFGGGNCVRFSGRGETLNVKGPFGLCSIMLSAMTDMANTFIHVYSVSCGSGGFISPSPIPPQWFVPANRLSRRGRG